MLIPLLVASALRFTGLGRESLWNDELATWASARHESAAGVVREGVRPDTHPPAYALLVHFVLTRLGDSEEWLRLPSAVAGVLGVAAIYFLGLRLYGRSEAVLAAVLMAVLWCPVYYSQEARANSILVLMALVTFYLWLPLLEDLRRGSPVSRLTAAAYVVAAVLTCYLHYMGLYLVALQSAATLAVLAPKPRALLRGGALYLPVVAAYVPWWPTMLEQWSRGASWIPSPGITFFLRFLRFLFNHSYLIAGMALLLYASLFFRGLRFAWPRFARPSGGAGRGREGASTAILLLWLLLPPLGLYVLSILVRPVLINRNLLISLPPAYLLAAHACSRIPLVRRRHAAAGAVIGLLLLGHLLCVLDYYRVPRKTQFREAVEYVARSAAPGGKTLVMAYSWGQDNFEYYFRMFGSPLRVDVIAGEEAQLPAVFAALERDRPEYVWYLTAQRTPTPGFMAGLTERLSVVETREFLEAQVWLLRPAGPADAPPVM